MSLFSGPWVIFDDIWYHVVDLKRNIYNIIDLINEKYLYDLTHLLWVLQFLMDWYLMSIYLFPTIMKGRSYLSGYLEVEDRTHSWPSPLFTPRANFTSLASHDPSNPWHGGTQWLQLNILTDDENQPCGCCSY